MTDFPTTKVLNLVNTILNVQHLDGKGTEIRQMSLQIRDALSDSVVKLGGHLISHEKYNEIMREVGNQRKIAAIKILRSETGLGLKDAKDIIDKL